MITVHIKQKLTIIYYLDLVKVVWNRKAHRTIRTSLLLLDQLLLYANH